MYLGLSVQILGTSYIFKAISSQILSIPYCSLRYLVFLAALIFVDKITMSLAHLLPNMYHMLLFLSKQNSYLSLSCEVTQCSIISWVFCIRKVLLTIAFLTESSNYPNRPISISKLSPVKTYSTCMTRELLINFQIIKLLSDD